VDTAYFDLDNDGHVEDVEHGPWPALETSEGAAGAMISTAADVTAFTSALLSGRILKPQTVELMAAPSPFARRYDDYGLGVELDHPDLRTPVRGHGGFLPGYRCVTWYVPSEHATVTVMVNHSQGDSTDLATLLLAELQRHAG
jgi:D-alanyl-D-alanine carboxypeptidase